MDAGRYKAGKTLETAGHAGEQEHLAHWGVIPNQVQWALIFDIFSRSASFETIESVLGYNNILLSTLG